MAITTITKEMVSVNAIQGTLIADNAITAVHIATNAVSGTLIADNAVTATHIAQNTITVTQLADDCVESAKIADGIITTNHLNKAMISSQTEVTPVAGDFVLIGDTSDSNNLKKAATAWLPLAGGTLTGGLTGTTGTFSTAGNGNSPTIHIIDTADTEVAWFEGRRAGDTGAFISVYHNPSTPQETNRSGIRFQGDDDGGNKTNYVRITQYIEDNTNTTEDARLGINVLSDGSDNEVVNIRKDQFIYKGDAGSSFIRVDNRTDGHDTGFEIYQNGSRKWELHSDDSNTDAFEIRPDGASGKYTFMQDGKFGIGTASPAATLHIDTSTNSPLLVQSTHGTGGYIELKVSDNTSAGELTGFIGDSEALISSGTAGDFAIRAQEDFVVSTGGATERFKIDSSGNVGIGATSGGDRLEVHGGHFTIKGPSTSSQITFKESDGTINGYVYGHGTGPAVGFLDASGHWAFKHSHDTDHRFFIDNSTKAILNSSGVLSITGTLTENYSDDRLKENKVNIPNATTKIKSLNGFTYTANSRAQALGFNTDKQVGVSAQEVEAVLPEAVSLADAVNADHETDYKTVQYTKLVPLLIESIKELEARLTAGGL